MAPEAQEATSVTCPGVAVYSAGSGPEVHVTRRGSLSQQNALSPRTEAPPWTVLEVTIRGRLAATYGASFQEMHRAGPPDELERELGNAIQWQPNLAGLPRVMVLIGDEQSEVIAKLRFAKCGPKPKRAAAPQPLKAKPSEAPEQREQRPPAPVPRGAIEEVSPRGSRR
jgi:hypothetical protein